jgi:hypothetical protein
MRFDSLSGVMWLSCGESGREARRWGLREGAKQPRMHGYGLIYTHTHAQSVPNSLCKLLESNNTWLRVLGRDMVDDGKVAFSPNITEASPAAPYSCFKRR